MLLDVKNLNTSFMTHDGEVSAVNDVSFSLMEGECLGIVGESGSGKTQIFMSIMGLLAKNGKARGSVLFEGKEILGLKPAELNKLRGVEFSMIFQDPMTSLNPYLKISRQMTEVLMEHQQVSKKEAREKAIKMLEMVGIPEAKKRFTFYPHEFSGGMRQRVMIAMALLCRPKMLIADEPTTALDVTIQAQILEILARLKQKLNMATILITHDLGVIASLCDRVIVMYGGKIMEEAPVNELFYNPGHPYTRGLLRSMPRIDTDSEQELLTIEGQPPDLQQLPPGCSFAPRCQYVMDKCLKEQPSLHKIGGKHKKACFLERIP